MFDKEEYKKEVFRKYQKKLNSKITFRNRVKKMLLATTCCATILLTTILIYAKNKLYEKDSSNSKSYYYDKKVNIVENKEINNSNNNSLISEKNEVDDSNINYSEENNIVEPPNEPINTEPSSEFFKLLKINEINPDNYGSEEITLELLKEKNIYYGIEEYDYASEIMQDCYLVEKQEGKLVVTIKDTERMRSILRDAGDLGIEYGKSYIIDNVKTEDIDTILYAAYGQDIYDPLIVYLKQKDGTVEGIDIRNGCKTGNFVIDKVKDLKDVEKLVEVTSYPLDDSGWRTTFAITNDNKIYDLDAHDYNISKIY